MDEEGSLSIYFPTYEYSEVGPQRYKYTGRPYVYGNARKPIDFMNHHQRINLLVYDSDQLALQSKHQAQEQPE